MRKSKREVKNFDEIVDIMKRCDVCRLGLNDGECPYILPLNFGLSVENGEITLYFHSALEGYKVDLLKKNKVASFEMDCNHALKYSPEQGRCTMNYESVMGKGELIILDESEKAQALTILMKQYHTGDGYYNPAAIPRTLVYCLKVTSLTAKRYQSK